MNGAAVGGEDGWFFAVIDELFGKGKTASGLATCALFTEIGRIARNVEDHVAVMIVECGIGGGSPRDLITKQCRP